MTEAEVKLEIPSAPPGFEGGDEFSSEGGIYVSEIAQGVTDVQLLEGFSQCCPIAAAHIIRNKFTNESKGFGFLKLVNLDDAKKIISWDQLPRFKDVKTGQTQQVKVTFAEPRTKLFITNLPNLPPQVIQRELEELTETKITSLIPLADNPSQAYADFTDHASAVKALKVFQKRSYHGNVLASKFGRRPRNFDDGCVHDIRTLFIRNVPAGTTDSELTLLFGGREFVSGATVPLDKKRGTGAALGHAFVYFHGFNEAASVLEKAGGWPFKGRMLELEWCFPKELTKGVSAREQSGPGGGLGGYPGGGQGGGWHNPRVMRGGGGGGWGYNEPYGAPYGGGPSHNRPYGRRPPKYEDYPPAHSGGGGGGGGAPPYPYDPSQDYWAQYYAAAAAHHAYYARPPGGPGGAGQQGHYPSPPADYHRGPPPTAHQPHPPANYDYASYYNNASYYQQGAGAYSQGVGGYQGGGGGYHQPAGGAHHNPRMQGHHQPPPPPPR